MAATNVVFERQSNGRLDHVSLELFLVTCTVDFASAASGANATDTATVAGLALGDIVLGISAIITTQNLVLSADVSAANTLTVRASNLTGGAVDLASTTLKILVARPKF